MTEQQITTMNMNTLSYSQIIWAAQHDWYVADNGDGTITVAASWSGGLTIIGVFGGSFAALRDWAGY